jgi:extracellular matrix regulatory protein A
MSNNYNGILDSEAPRLVNVGHGNFVLVDRIVAILGATSLPMKRLRERATQDNMLVDATAGRKTKSVVITDSKHVFLSALAPQTLQERLGQGKSQSSSQLEWQDGQFAS